MADLNRLKVVLAENKTIAKWLATKMGKASTTVSKWCANSNQPSVETFSKIAEILEVDIRELLVSTNQQYDR